MRSKYWTCSTFADWLRGSMKPHAETAAGWSEWRKAAKKSHPFRFWLAEEGLDKLQNFLLWPSDKYNDIRYYIKNRWVVKSNSLTAHPRDIVPGRWCDVGNRFIPCLFNELVDFIEIEKAWSQVHWNDYAKKYNAPAKWHRRYNPFHVWRCPEAGIDHLKWEMQLVDETAASDDIFASAPTHQAIAAREQYELYKWWTEVRPARPDPYEVSGWTDILINTRPKDEDDDGFMASLDSSNATPEEQKTRIQALEEIRELEDKYEREDEEMLIRLIKIRNSLWT